MNLTKNFQMLMYVRVVIKTGSMTCHCRLNILYYMYIVYTVQIARVSINVNYNKSARAVR